MNFYKTALLSAILWPAIASAKPFQLNVTGGNFHVSKRLDIGKVDSKNNFIKEKIKDKSGGHLSFEMKYKNLPSNRSFPTNLDITIKDSGGKKLGYLFFAINSLDFLSDLGEWGMVVNINNQPVDFKFVFDKKTKGTINFADLDSERFFQDTLMNKLNFQMIRPVIIPVTAKGTRSIEFPLDSHPYSVEYKIKDQKNGVVEFQHNFYSTSKSKKQLLERIYYQADSIQTLRQAMYAAKFFGTKDGTAKLVFYPALGQTQAQAK